MPGFEYEKEKLETRLRLTADLLAILMDSLPNFDKAGYPLDLVRFVEKAAELVDDANLEVTKLANELANFERLNV